MAPLRKKLAEIAALNDASSRLAAFGQLRAELPALLRGANAGPATAAEIERAMSAAFFNAVADAQLTTQLRQTVPTPSA